MNAYVMAVLQIIGMLFLMIIAEELICKELVSKLIMFEVELTKEKIRGIKWVIFIVIGILTVYSSLLRLLLSL